MGVCLLWCCFSVSIFFFFFFCGTDEKEDQAVTVDVNCCMDGNSRSKDGRPVLVNRVAADTVEDAEVYNYEHCCFRTNIANFVDMSFWCLRLTDSVKTFCCKSLEFLSVSRPLL